MRTTIELDDALHDRTRRQAQREGIPLSRLLGRLVEQALKAPVADTLPLQDSGRFRVVAPAVPGAVTSTGAVQRLIDEEGVL